VLLRALSANHEVPMTSTRLPTRRSILQKEAGEIGSKLLRSVYHACQDSQCQDYLLDIIQYKLVTGTIWMNDFGDAYEDYSIMF
jgi:hypothetical protein